MIARWRRAADALAARNVDGRELMMLIALTLGEPTVSELPHQLHDDGIRWEVLEQLAHDHALSAALFEALVAHGISEGAPSAVRARLEERSLNTRLQNQLLLADLADVAALARTASIDAVALKGAALLATVFSSSLDRHTDDIDLMVRPAGIARLAEQMRARGYIEQREEVISVTGERVVRDDHYRATAAPHQPLALVSPRGTVFELHLSAGRPHEVERLRLTLDELLTRSVEVELPTGKARINANADLLVHLCHHVLVHHQYEKGYRLRHLRDMSAMRRVPELQPAIAEAAARCEPVRRSLAQLEAIERALACNDRRGLAVLAHRVTRRTGVARAAAREALALARSNPRAAWRYVMPAPAYLEWKYDLPPGRAAGVGWMLRRLAGRKRTR